MIDGFTNLTKANIDVRIRITDNHQAEMFQKRGSACVIGLSLLIIMLRAIHFDNKSGACAVEVDNISPNNPLFIYLYRIMPQEIVP